MKLYATTTSEKASKSQGGNKELDFSLSIGSTANSKQVLRILARVLPKEASISDKESVVIMIMKENEEGHIQEITERLVYSLPSCIEIHTRKQAVALKEEDNQSIKCYEEHEHGKYKGLSVPHYHDMDKKGKRQKGENINGCDCDICTGNPCNCNVCRPELYQ